MDALYRDEILEHYRRPHHAGMLAEASHTAELDNPLCGDRISLQLRVAGGHIAEVAFVGRGCAISQAAASMLADAVVDLPVAEAQALSSADVMELLGIEVSPSRYKCATLGLETLARALASG